MALRRTPLREPYTNDVTQFTKSLYPEICQYFMGWCYTKFNLGDDIYVLDELNSTEYYRWNHSGVTICTNQKWHPLTRNTENAAISKWRHDEKKKEQQKIMVGEINEEVSPIVKTSRYIHPQLTVGELLTTYTPKGVQYAALWERELHTIARMIAEEVARAYVKEHNAEVARFVGFEAMKKEEFVPVMLAEALEGEQTAVLAMKEWYTELGGDLGSITLLIAQAKAGMDARVVKRNRQDYDRWKERMTNALRREAQSIPLSEDEQHLKIRNGEKNVMYAHLALNLTPRQLSLAAWSGRLNLDNVMYQRLSKPIQDEFKMIAKEERKKYLPLEVTFKVPEFHDKGKEVAV